jgi:hypothetical protein
MRAFRRLYLSYRVARALLYIRVLFRLEVKSCLSGPTANGRRQMRSFKAAGFRRLKAHVDTNSH